MIDSDISNNNNRRMQFICRHADYWIQPTHNSINLPSWNPHTSAAIL